MTEEIMALHGLMEESADTDLLREMIGFAAERLMELEVGGLTGAAHNEKSAERLENDRIVSAAVIVTVGVNSDGRREVLGMDVGSSEAATFWTAFLRKLARRGRRGSNSGLVSFPTAPCRDPPKRGQNTFPVPVALEWSSRRVNFEAS
ncbi:hypothetical protein ASF32_18610 [Methylobacterium sp. Leaf91]|nr:hypothetical protein ASF32_18610 [Methylobacterium sp. Leaf91]